MDALHLINTLKAKAGHMAYSSFLYDWSLSTKPPERLLVRLADPWKGDAEKASELMIAAGVGERTGPQWHDHWWEPEDADAIWSNHMHSFIWLRDLRTLGGGLAREQGRMMIESWINRYKYWNAQSWSSDLLGKRIAMWISHHDYFCDHADEAFQDLFMASLIKQAKHLYNALGDPRDLSYFDAIKGLLYAGLALEGHERWIGYALTSLEKGIAQQILEDGGHASRSPSLLLKALEAMADMKSALRAGGHPIPDFLEDTIQNMTAAVRFFRHGDRKLALFHGTQEGDNSAIDSILAQAGARGKAKYSLPFSGFERASLGRSLLLLDVGKSPENGLDKITHAAPLAFEFSHGNARILTSCGAHPTSDEWNEALRFTAAHNTATLDYRNACEIRKDGHFGRKVTQYALSRQENNEAILLEASHNGYAALNGITHARKLFLANEGYSLRGEDDFTAKHALSRCVEIALRFHLHPSVKVEIEEQSGHALLTVPGVSRWRFIHSAGELALEDSLYLGKGITPRKTKQLVIYGQMTEEQAQVKWCLKHE